MIPSSIDNEIDNAFTCLSSGGILLYPTDTVWGIGCDATENEAVKKIYKLKGRPDNKALICLVSDIPMLTKIVGSLPHTLRELLRTSNRPTTIIYPRVTNLASNLLAADGSAGIRVASDTFCQSLIRKFGKPIVSTSANPSGSATPYYFKDIHPSILEGVDYAVNLQRDQQCGSPSRVIKWENDGTLTVLRP